MRKRSLPDGARPPTAPRTHGCVRLRIDATGSAPRPAPRAASGALAVLGLAWAAVVGADAGDAGPFARHALPGDFPLATITGAPWRFDFELDLVRAGTDLLVVEGDGGAVRHAPRRALPDGTWRWLATDGSGSLIEGAAGEHSLRWPDGAVTRFVRGRPTDTLDAEGRHRRWRYEGDRLSALVDDEAGTLAIDRDAGGAAVRLRLPGGDELLVDGAPASAAPSAPRARPWCPADEGCDVAGSPPGEAFTTGPHVPGASTLDLRPASCRSYFVDYRGTGRGNRIEDAFDAVRAGRGLRHTARDFPVVDFVGADVLVSIRSRDLSSPTYANPARPALFDQLMRDGRDAERLLLGPLRDAGFVSASPRDGERDALARIDAAPARRLVFELVIQHGVAGPDQIRQIERARAELAARHGIELRVLEIP